MWLKRTILSALILIGAINAGFGQSTVNVNIPTAGTPVEQGGPALRQNFLNTFNDINTLYGLIASSGHACMSVSSVCVGSNAGLAMTGINNVAVGNSALQNASAASIVAVGSFALQNLTSGTGNVGIGTQALQALTTSNSNTAVGDFSALSVTGTENTYIGFQSGVSGSTEGDNTAIGARSLQVHNSGLNVAVGALAATNLTGLNYVCIGFEACFTGPSNATNQSSIGIGTQALLGLTSGTDNLGIGFAALSKIATAGNSLAIGNRALANMIDGGAFSGANMGIGSDALGACTTCSENTIVGRGAAEVMVTGDQNVGVGVQALQSALAGVSFSTSIGTSSLGGLTGGIDNTALGQGAGYGTEGVGTALACTTCQHGTFLGAFTTLNAAAQRDHVTVIGANAAAAVDAANTLTLGRVTGTIDTPFAAAYAVAGSLPALTGSCAVVAGTRKGGQTAGEFAIPAGNCAAAATITVTFAINAPNGLACDMHNLNTPTSILDQTGRTASATAPTATFTVRSVTSTAADVVVWKCTPY